MIFFCTCVHMYSFAYMCNKHGTWSHNFRQKQWNVYHIIVRHNYKNRKYRGYLSRQVVFRLAIRKSRIFIKAMVFERCGFWKAQFLKGSFQKVWFWKGQLWKGAVLKGTVFERCGFWKVQFSKGTVFERHGFQKAPVFGNLALPTIHKTAVFSQKPKFWAMLHPQSAKTAVLPM